MPGRKPTFETISREPSPVLHVCNKCGAWVEQPAEGRALFQIRDRASRYDSAKVCRECYIELTGQEP